MEFEERNKFSKPAGARFEGEQEYPSTTAQAAYPTAEQVLQQIRNSITEGLFSQAQLEQMVAGPLTFIRCLIPNPVSTEALTIADQVMQGIAIGYFQSLLAKATEGEKYDEGRMNRALLKARTTAIEALEQVLQEPNATVEQRIRIVELLKED